MKIINARNVCQALSQTMEYLYEHGEREISRAGEVLVSPCPMITVTAVPQERVLFSAARDANPFFHLAEAIWMLAGRNDAKFLDQFIKTFSRDYAEADGSLHDAYGYRWRHGIGFDQLDVVVKKLLLNPADRQCVIQMWDASESFFNDLKGDWKGRPCNTHIFLRLRGNALDLTTCCRSNDMLWGCHGANAVHFSILQEYLAARLEADVGIMYQISNNAHIYIDKLNSPPDNYNDDRYGRHLSHEPMFEDPFFIDDDIKKFMSDIYSDKDDYYNPWFYTTMTKAMQAHKLFKEKQYAAALMKADEIEAPDWRKACYEWINRRVK